MGHWWASEPASDITLLGDSGDPWHLNPMAIAACLSLSTLDDWPVQGGSGSQLQTAGTLKGSRKECGGTGILSVPLLSL